MCYKKLIAGYNAALLTGDFCEFWRNFQLDDCMIDQPIEQLDYQTYWVHPDHLGSSSVITNQSGTTTNWYEYMPFGEMLMEQSNNEYNNPFKYNGKELDEATGLYYYGARYMDPKTSIWLSVDPLAIYNPVFETEFYGDGQHNGGVFYSGNLNPYIYTYQNPILYVDPNGKQNVAGSLFGFIIPPINPGNSPLMQMQHNLVAQKIGAIGAGVIGDFATGGTLDKLFLAYNAGAATHSMQMQSYWRDRGNNAAAKKYEQEGADATANLSLYGAGTLGMQGIKQLRNAVRPGLNYGQKLGIIREALQGEGNFGLGVATEKEALQLEKDFVGQNYIVFSDKSSWVSSDKLRQFRPPSIKKQSGRYQANFETRDVPRGKWTTDGHLDIKKK